MNHPSGSDEIVFDQPAPSESKPLPSFLISREPRALTVERARPSRVKRWGFISIGLGLIGGVGVGGFFVQRIRQDAARSETVRELPVRLVSRVDFQTRMTAAGRVESHQKTMITCQIERLSVSNEGRMISSNGTTQILDVVEEGRQVKKGDVLCRLNSTDFEEMVRTQQMKTEQARAALEQAQLSFDVAELAVSEYREGLRQQSTQDMEGQIALAQSDLERAEDRLRWTRDMLVKGYVPVAQKTSAERSVSQLRLKLLTSRWNLSNFKDYGNPRTIKELISEVEKRRYEVTANSQRVTRLDERLDHYRKMVDFCTIRAPHDGMLIYAVDPWRRNAPRLEPGVDVREQQQLFYIPDLTDMEVITYLHESVAQQARIGQSAQVKIEGVGNQVLTGKLVNIGPLPVLSPTWTTSEEVKYFVATIKLDRIPPGLLPGMTAEVDIDLNRSQDVLAVPTEAVAFEQGGDVCYVAGLDGLERRHVTVGRSNRNLLEVTRGLAEGEEVVINPAQIDSIDSLLVHSEETSKEAPALAPSEPSVFNSGPVGVE